ncbi:hypothetical protein NL676_031164 [Syzygium grande]|nr:hypothetical protein NL676_031164 [Syzygium grande]
MILRKATSRKGRGRDALSVRSGRTAELTRASRNVPRFGHVPRSYWSALARPRLRETESVRVSDGEDRAHRIPVGGDAAEKSPRVGKWGVSGKWTTRSGRRGLLPREVFA